MRSTTNKYSLWTSGWTCEDGDGVSLIIFSDENLSTQAGFELSCFSGIPESKIIVGELDFNALIIKVEKELGVKFVSIETYEMQCLIIADWLCSKFCEYQK